MESTLADENLTTVSTNTTTSPRTVGPLQYFEVAYLTLLVIVGTFGNVMVILSIVYAKKAHKNGNVFIINLAVADLLITGFVIPTVIASVLQGGNALDETGCTVVGVGVTISCTCSIYNLMFIAANRCCSIATPMRYDDIFSRKYENMMVLGIWLWAVVLMLPVFLGWGGAVSYEPYAFACYWSDGGKDWYTVFITLFAVLIPLTIIGLCYARLFYAVVRSTQRVRSISLTSTSVRNGRSLNREQRLFRTLFTTVVVFIVCWVPFTIDALVKEETAHAKKVFAWLALTNSSVNFIIYGALNSGFRKGYINVLCYIFCCREERRNNRTRNNVYYASDSSTSIRRQNNLVTNN